MARLHAVDVLTASPELIADLRRVPSTWTLRADSAGILTFLGGVLMWETVFQTARASVLRAVGPKDVARLELREFMLPSYITSTVHALVLSP